MSSSSSSLATPENIMRVHRAMGGGVLQWKKILEELPKFHAERLLIAIQQQKGHRYYDPIEDDPKIKPLIEQAALEADQVMSLKTGKRRGYCHGQWNTMQRILREQHNIEWLTPAQMNPGSCFD